MRIINKFKVITVTETLYLKSTVRNKVVNIFLKKDEISNDWIHSIGLRDVINIKIEVIPMMNMIENISWDLLTIHHLVILSNVNFWSGNYSVIKIHTYLTEVRTLIWIIVTIVYVIAQEMNWYTFFTTWTFPFIFGTFILSRFTDNPSNL